LDEAAVEARLVDAALGQVRVRVGGPHEACDLGVQDPDARQEVEPRHARYLVVAEDDVHLRMVQDAKGLLGAARREDLDPGPVEDGLEDVADGGLVVDDEDDRRGKRQGRHGDPKSPWRAGGIWGAVRRPGTDAALARKK